MKKIKEIEQEEKKVLIKLSDANIVDIIEESFSDEGCETCDYGSSYGVEYDFIFEDGSTEHFELEEMYDSPISEGQMIKFLITNLDEFKQMTKAKFMEFISDYKNIV